MRPIPLFIRGVGVGTGRYERLITGALEILRKTSPQVTSEAWFDLDLLDELAIDPQAVRFRSPGEQAPQLSFRPVGSAPYRRSRTLSRALCCSKSCSMPFRPGRCAPGNLDPDELWFEAAAVLAGTILMASGTSGSGPDTHGSATTLGTLVQQIAAYRDVYYEQLLAEPPANTASGFAARRPRGASLWPAPGNI